MKHLLALFVLLLLTLTGASVQTDGVLRDARASVGLLQVCAAGRCVKLAFCPFGPGDRRVYYRLQVAAL
jgi:hypothetical protein